MNRQFSQNIGLVIALIIASVSLPIGIMGFMKQPIINNYYNTYNTYNNYYNQTIISDDGTDYSTPMEMATYHILGQYYFILRQYTLSTQFTYWYYWNASTSVQIRLWACQSFFYDDVVALNGSSAFTTYIDNVKVYERLIGSDEIASYYSPPFEDSWLFIFLLEDSFSVDITLRDAILPI